MTDIFPMTLDAGDEDALFPRLEDSGRYEVSATVGLVTTIGYTCDLEVAKATLRQFLELPHANNRDAHGAVHDLRIFRTVHRWRGGMESTTALRHEAAADYFLHPESGLCSELTRMRADSNAGAAGERELAA